MKNNKIAEIKEKLADIEHQRWADWQEYMFDCAMIKSGDDNLNIRTFAWKTERVEGWNRQIETDYADLSEEEKQSDRNQVDRYWPLIEKLLTEQSEQIWKEAMECVEKTRVHCIGNHGCNIGMCLSSTARDMFRREAIENMKSAQQLHDNEKGV